MEDINGIENLRIESPFEFCELNSLRIYGRVNEHGRIIISGIIKQNNILDNVPQGKSVTVWGNDQQRPLFSGIVKSFYLTEEGGLSQATIECSSFTALLDQELHSRSFQDPEMRYRDLLETAGKRFGQKNRLLVTAKEASRNIGAPVIQYQETDWEFLKRIAGRLHTILISETTYPMTQLSIGCIRGESYRLEEPEEYEEYLDLDRFRKFGAGKSKRYYMSYRIKTYENYELGDRIQWRGQEFRVFEKNLLLKRGMIEGEYLLGFEPAFCLEVGTNTKIRGVSISGSVIDRKEGMLKVHLEIDSEQDPKQAYWYPYSPMTGNIMYSVPEIGTEVLLNIKSEWEEDAVISCCVRKKSELFLPTEIKTMWTDGGYYTAAPEYMGFNCEGLNELSGAFALDDELGLLMYAKKRVSIRANGTVFIGSNGSVSLNGVSETKLVHPKGKEEQAWIAMDCGRMRLGGSFIVHSGVTAGKNMGQTNEAVVNLDTAIAESLSMIPMAAKSVALQDSGLETEIYYTMSSVVSNEPQNGTVMQMQESMDSTEEAEKEAYIYVGGHYHPGEVRGGQTYVKKNYNQFLDDFFTDVDNSLYSIEITVNKVTGEHRKYVDKLYNLSVEKLAQETGYTEMLSSWEQSDTVRIVVCNPLAQNAPYQLVRKGRNINVKLYAKINAYKKDDSEDPNVRTVKPFENEKKGWFDSEEDEVRRNYTFYDFIIAGLQKWEGVYENHSKTIKYYDNPKGKWYTKKNKYMKINYDNFGLDGAVEVKIELVSPTDLHPKGTRIYIFDNRQEAISKTVYDEYNDKDLVISNNYNWSCITDYTGKGFTWSVLNVGTMLLFIKLISEKKKYESTHKSKDFVGTVGHEFGHIWGIHDAYKKEDVDGWSGAKVTEEIEKNNIMKNNGVVQSNDIEMMLQASMENQTQYHFYSIYGKKSSVIRLD